VNPSDTTNHPPDGQTSALAETFLGGESCPAAILPLIQAMIEVLGAMAINYLLF
jgi:hypothetical protein